MALKPSDSSPYRADQHPPAGPLLQGKRPPEKSETLSPEGKPELQQSQMITTAKPPAEAKPRPATSVSAGPVKKRLGEILTELKLISPEQLQRALAEAKATATPLGSILVKQGYIDEASLGKALAKLHGMEYLDIKSIQLDDQLMGLLPEQFIRKHLVVPVALHPETKRMEVVISRPDKLGVLDEVSLLTGYRPIVRVSTHKELLRLIDQYFLKKMETDDVLAKVEQDLSSKETVYADGFASELESEMMADDAPVVQLVNAILLEAIEVNASDVHIEPQKERLLVRFRVDGILQEVKSLPKRMANAVISRIKVASGMDIAERRRPQDGRMSMTMASQDIDMRVNTLGVQFGEKIVIRILRSTATTGGMERLGLSECDAKKFSRMIKSPNGIILVTGPTGSGKTTTLYSGLREINASDINITTIEDPIEYPLPGINQTQVSYKAGLDFAVCLRSILRQDPDVIMVGEIRDTETLEASIHAALTGHLVFSTIHTNSTAKTISRLTEMGAAPYLVSSALVGIMAQRLVRTICPQCKEGYEASSDEKETLGKPLQMPLTLYRGKGCDVCGQSGYFGRQGLYEIMPITREIQEMIDKQASIFLIEDMAVSQGMTTLAMNGREKVLSGITTLSEATRVLGFNLGG